MLSLPPLNLRQAVCILLATWTEIVFAAPFDELTPNSTPPPAATSQGEDSTEQKSVSIDVARDRAKLMHEVYLATLNVMHDRYFHADRAIVPARAMQDVFREIEYKTSSKANWISVNLKAMSIDHEPKTKFEKRAAKEISKGVTGVESIEQGGLSSSGCDSHGNWVYRLPCGIFQTAVQNPQVRRTGNQHPYRISIW